MIEEENYRDGADRRKRRIRLVERFIKRAGDDGLSNSEIEAMSAYQLGLTGKKSAEIVQVLKRLRKIKFEKGHWKSI